MEWATVIAGPWQACVIFLLLTLHSTHDNFDSLTSPFFEPTLLEEYDFIVGMS